MENLPEIGFKAYGVPLTIRASSDDLLPRVQAMLPPGWQPNDPAEAQEHFGLITPDGVSYRVYHNGGSVSGSSDVGVALEVLDSQLRAYIALHAPELIFVHAGVVAHGGRAIVIPGPSFSGKSTLVAELVTRGATYYSDEFAVLDGEGLVHPFPKPLSLRFGTLTQTNHDVASFGGVAGDSPIEVGLIAVARYRPGAEWDPRHLSPGEGVLTLLSNTVAAQERPAEVMPVITKAAAGAIVLDGDRGEASVVAEQLLAGVFS